jgi:DNA adenine methylase
LSRVINVASVPQRSPFRYPGGKTWLVPRIRQWLKQSAREFIEPYAGGGIVSLTVAAEQLADHVTMVELDEQVAAVWITLIEDGDGAWLAERVVSFDLTHDSLRDVLAKETCSVRERAFQTILKNRTFRGGILAPGAAPLKQGENGKGIHSRWYPETLKRRILDIDAIRHRLTFIEGDGLEIIKQNKHRPDATFFVDPPYTVAGKRAGRRLYKYADLNHQELFRMMSTVAGDFLMTYDETGEVRELARTYGFDTELVAMKNTHHAEMSELLVGRNLDWARQGQNG